MSEATNHTGGSCHTTFPNKSALLAHEDGCHKISGTSLSLSNYSDADTSSSDDSDLNDNAGKMKKRVGWKIKIRDLIDVQMKKLMEKQEAWMEKMMRTIEEKERERAMREEEWRKHDAARIEREQKFWASERAWIESRGAALMDALHNLTGKETITCLSEDKGGGFWPECEINRLIQITTPMEGKFGVAEEMVWEEIARKMACFGHERSAAVCKEKWESINNYVLKCSKKRKDNSKSDCYFQSHGGGGGEGAYCEQGNTDHHHSLNNNDDHGSSSPNTNAASGISDSCFRYFMGDTYGRIID